MMNIYGKIVAMMTCMALLAFVVHPAAAEGPSVSYLYKLSDFVGAVPYSSPRIFADKVKNEIYVVYGGGVAIYNPSGMEIFRTDYDPEIGSVYDLAVDRDGNVILLAFMERKALLRICNYRLELLRDIEVKGLPPEFSDFTPNQLKYHEGRLYLASTGSMKVVVIGVDGNFIKGYDLVAMLGDELIEKEKNKGRKSAEQTRADNGLDGFAIDNEGNILFVLPVLGRAGRILTDGTVTLFGKRGNGQGKFGVPGGITADRWGNYLVSDRLRNYVIIFNNELRFIKEFGYLGARGSKLASPTDMDMDGRDNLYVGQVGAQGVNVYHLANEGEI